MFDKGQKQSSTLSCDSSYIILSKGLLLPPVPPVMKTTKISIPKLNNMEPIVHNFTRYEKVQVEYILLKFLTKLLQPRHGDLGYKGMLDFVYNIHSN